MKFTKLESLHNALKDEAILLKNLEFDDYIELMSLKTKLSTIIEENQELQKNLIEEYNKPFVEKRNSEEFKKALIKEKDSRSQEETALLAEQAPVRMFNNGIISGPTEFIDKFNKLTNREYNIETKILKDKKSFKATFENVPIEKQAVLFETLLK